MSLREDLMRQTSRAQRGVRVSPGDRFVRGMTTVFVIEAGSTYRWREEASGEIVTGDRRAFAGRALERLRTPVAPGDVIATAWSLATINLPMGDRVALLTGALGDVAVDADARSIIDGWIAALRRGEEPTR